MVQKYKCDNCGKITEETGDFYRLNAVMKRGNKIIKKNFCGLRCANAWNLTHKKGKPFMETLEQEIKEAIEEEREHVEEVQEIAEEQEKFGETAGEKQYERTGGPESEVAYGPDKGTQAKYAAEPHKVEYIENQDFYIRREEDFDAVKNTMHEIKAQESGMSRIDDSDLWEIEPETKKLKIRKMPRGTLDMLKQKGILIDYYKQL